MASSYQCPLCQQPLVLTERSWRCEQRHSFDVAKEGYVNLLPVQQKNSLNPGDSKQMLQARRAFLEAGHYAPLVKALQQQVVEQLPSFSSDNGIRWLDIGAGEGYYTNHLAEILPAASESYGMDISKTGMKLAAKRYRQVNWAVASAYQLPYLNNSFDLMVRVYAPSDVEEIARCLKPDGQLLTVTPAPGHLFEFKQALYAEPNLHSDVVTQYPHFEHRQRERLTLTIAADEQTYQQLLTMTPLGWKVTADNNEVLNGKIESLTADFFIDRYASRTS